MRRTVELIPSQPMTALPRNITFDCADALASSAFIRHRILNYSDAPGAERVSAPVHDALCVASLVHPEVLTEVYDWPVNVETRGEHTLGETVFDSRPWVRESRIAHVALRADAQIFAQFLADAFTP